MQMQPEYITTKKLDIHTAPIINPLLNTRNTHNLTPP